MSDQPELVDHFLSLLAARLAPLVARELAGQFASTSTVVADDPAIPDVTLEEFVARLPSTRSRKTWRRWLYAKLQRPEGVPGAVKIGREWHLNSDRARRWIANGAP